MAELGPDGPAEHVRIAGLARELGIRVIAVGTDLYGSDLYGSEAFGELDIGEADAVLVKGSRVAGLEAVAERLLQT
jgi:UDP-N-acetylmuramoyl-tripeptide--D-alanyl-D-alanine ligase